MLRDTASFADGPTDPRLGTKGSPFGFSAKRFAILATIAIFPLLFFQGLKLGLYPAHARAGDEPHYLTILNSIVRDGDLDLSNNYRERQSGLLFRNFEIDHHSYLVSPDRKKVIPFEEVFRMERVESGAYRLRRTELHKGLDLSEYVETPLHSAGYPSLLAPLLAPFIYFNFDHYETIAILFQMFYFVAAILALFSLFESRVAKTPGVPSTGRVRYGVFIVTALSMPIWVLNASFYAEGVIGSALIFLLYGYAKKDFWPVALHIPLLVFIKEIYIPVAALFALFYTLRESRPVRRQIPLLVFIASLILFLTNNYIRYSNPFRSYIPYTLNPEPFRAVVQLLTSDTKGIIAFTPHLIILPFASLLLYRRSKRDFLLLFSVTAYLLTATVLHKNWSGGPSFSYRTVAPALFMLFPYVHDAIENSGRFIRPMRIVLAISFLNMFFAISNMHFSYASGPFINLIHPTHSILYNMLMPGNR
jgi:hypothetical protein